MEIFLVADRKMAQKYETEAKTTQRLIEIANYVNAVKYFVYKTLMHTKT